MPWKVSCPVDERMKFVTRLKNGERMADLCREFEISRKTGYKFLRRFEQYSAIGLYDQRRVPQRVKRTAPATCELLLQLRREHPTWGARKLRRHFRVLKPDATVPATSTVNELLKANGLVATKPRRQKPTVTYSPLCHAQAPNDVWSIDFKGQFALGNRRLCYPLTLCDAFSRFLLGCDALESTKEAGVRESLTRTFRQYGLPAAIRSDNGTPFASTALAGLSRLSVWWLRLGIRLERIEPGQPQQNGRHERMHRTLKAETTRPAGSNLLQQQERFDAFQDLYNYQRPHQALEDQVPAALYRPSLRAYPEVLPDAEYPTHDLTTRVTECGHVSLPGSGRRGGRYFLSRSLGRELVGLREVDDDVWLVTFLQLDLGLLDTRTRRLRALPTAIPVVPEADEPEASAG